MTKSVFAIVLLVGLGVSWGTLRSAPQADDTDVDRASMVVAGRTLLLNGIGYYKKFFFSVYKVSLYVEDLSSKPEQILEPSQVKYARMVFQRDVSSSQIRDAWKLDFRTQCADACDKLLPQLEPVLDKIPDMKKGEILEFTYLPDRWLVRKPGLEAFEVEGHEFGHFQLGTWLGEKPPSKSFKKGLLNAD